MSEEESAFYGGSESTKRVAQALAGMIRFTTALILFESVRNRVTIERTLREIVCARLCDDSVYRATRDGIAALPPAGAETDPPARPELADSARPLSRRR